MGLVLCCKELGPRKREPWVLIEDINLFCDLGQMSQLAYGISFFGKLPFLYLQDIHLCKYMHTPFKLKKKLKTGKHSR